MPAARTASATAPSIRVPIELPQSLYDDYTADAVGHHKTAEESMVARLKSCRSHTAQRGLYLNDAEREEAEQLLGGALFQSSTDLVRALKTAYTVHIGGADVRLPPDLYTFFKDRAGEMSRPAREIILEVCMNALSDYVYGGH